MNDEHELIKYLKDSLAKTPVITRLEVLKHQSEKELIRSRLDQYYHALESSVSKGMNLEEAEGVAKKILLKGLPITEGS